jgi:TM2 domain-containing membrane protein YozV
MKKLKKQPIFKEDAGKLMLDLGKLVFGSICLGGVLRGGVPQNILVIGGFVVATILCIIGLLWMSKEKKIGGNGDSPAKQG